MAIEDEGSERLQSDFLKVVLAFQAAHVDIDPGVLLVALVHVVCEGTRERFRDGETARRYVVKLVMTWPGWKLGPKPP